jgi:hypothetical protein
MATLAAYMINDMVVAAPDSESWVDNVVGTALDLTQRRSAYKTLVWTKRAAANCDLDWFDYDNTDLDSLVTRAPGELKTWTRYTDVVCQSVRAVLTHQRGTQIEARFLVNTTP